MEKIIYPRFLLVKDNFYDNPEEVFSTAKSADFYEPENYTGFRSRDVYHQKNVRQKLERILGIRITRWDTDPREENGVFYFGLSKGSKSEVPAVHSDTPYNDITVVVYLTPHIPFRCGTSLWQHKKTGIMNPPTPQDARRLGMTLTELREQFEQEARSRSKWIEIDRAGYRCNRMVAYPSGALHSATEHYGGSVQNGRVYQTFRIGVDWQSFRMK